MANPDKFNDLDGIAIIGMAGRFPGAKNIDQFWQNLRDRVESISFFSDQELTSAGVNPTALNNPNYVKAGAVLGDVEWFDAPFFGYSPREAEIIDPQQRLFLECAWEALETAGYDPDTYNGQISVYGGSQPNDYLLKNLYPNRDRIEFENNLQALIGNDKDYLTTRVSYKLNLRGPSIAVQTACSTSLVTVHLACDALLNGECDIALAGGVSINVPQKAGYVYREGGITSPDGHCRAFDANGQGTIFGSGMGIVVLKRLADAYADGDSIYAVIKGSAINNDGALKIGYTAPSAEGQAQVIAEALDIAEVDPVTITYIETHGTGTPLGDPIEIAALTKAFRANTDAKRFCAIGSVKTNIGHLNVAAGVAGLIKTILALKHQMIPPSLHFEQPNPKIDFTNSPFYVNTMLSEWKANDAPRRAGVSSFGVGGTNAHVILEEAPTVEPSGPSRPWQLLLLSAKTNPALETATTNLAEHLKQHPDLNLADVAFTLMLGRKAMNPRRMVVCHSLEDASNALEFLDPKRVFTSVQEPKERPVVFMFTGQGAQYVNMALELYQVEPTFREQVDRCSELLKPHLGLDLRDVLYPGEEHTEKAAQQLTQTAITQPALFVIEYALARLLIDWGVQPQAMIGHSIGEYVAACLAGVFSLEDALALVSTRGRLMNQLPAGSMLAVPLPEQEIQPLLGDELSLAAINGPSLCVVSGPTEAIDQLERELTEKGLGGRRLHTSHAFHSPMMEPILVPFVEQVKKITLHPPKIPYLSNVTGTWITPEQATDPNYWARHLRQTVRFSEGVRELLKETARVLLEVGPGQTLSSLAKRHLEKTGDHIILSSIRHPQEQQPDVAYLLNTLGKLWLAGTDVDWTRFYAGERRHRLSLPTYPFERQRYWIEPQKEANDDVGMKQTAPSLGKKLDIADWFYIPSWKQSMPPVLGKPGGQDEQRSRWLMFMDAGGLGDQLVKQLEQHSHNVVTVMAGEQFARLDERGYTIRPQHPEDYEALFEELETSEKLPDRIVHLWTVSSDRSNLGLDTFEVSQEFGFYSLLYLAQTIGKQKITNPLHLWVVSNNIYDVTGAEKLYPEQATILGPCKTIPQEYPNITCQYVDIDISDLEVRQATRLIKQLVAEISAEASDPVVVYRGRHRWVQTFEPVKLTAGSRNPRLREGGVYLITGGLGGIGLALAEYLAHTVHAKLVLVGRSTFPDKDEWEQWLTTHEDEDRVSRKIRKVQLLEHLGAEVLVVSADVANLEQMQTILTQAQERFGAIHGVVHAAGVAGGGMIQLKKPEIAASVLTPKVKGTWVLDELFKDTSLDLFVLCSSTFAITSRFGQVDYCGANAFMDAFAHYKAARDNAFTVSINWDGWKEVGMAVDATASLGAKTVQPASKAREVDHPLLDKCIVETPDQLVYFTELRAAKHWILDEHRLMGQAAVPGTAYLEMVRAAFEDYAKNGAIEISEVFFLTPLMVEDVEQKQVYTILERDGDVFDFRILSKSGSEDSERPRWQEHARGEIRSLSLESPARCDMDEIAARCEVIAANATTEEPKSKEESFIFWGPRWQSLKKVNIGKNEVLGNLELPQEFAADLEKLKLHPALLDVAVGLASQYFGEGPYLPLSYKRLKLNKPLCARVYSHVIYDSSHTSNKEIVTFDIVIMDENGAILAQIEGMSFKRVNSETQSVRKDRSLITETEAHYYENLVAVQKQSQNGFEGILPKEGVEAFSRILSQSTVPQVVVSVRDLHVVIEQVNTLRPSIPLEETRKVSSAESSHSRPNLQTAYVAPQNGSEQLLANIWQETLGIAQIGINDNFFELGGDSVIAIQIIAKANKAGFQLAPNLIFEYQTIAELATASVPSQNIQAEQVTEADTHIQSPAIKGSMSSDSDEFDWTQQDLDDIARALKKSIGDV